MRNLSMLYRHSLALLTDLYQLTMAYGYWKTRRTDDEAVFHLFFRKPPCPVAFRGGQLLWGYFDRALCAFRVLDAVQTEDAIAVTSGLQVVVTVLFGTAEVSAEAFAADPVDITRAAEADVFEHLVEVEPVGG